MDILKNLLKKLTKNTKKCPECGAELSKDAKVCPECGYIFINQSKQKFKIYNFNQNCCITLLILLILLFWIVWKIQSIQKLLLAVILAAILLLIILVVMFGGLLFKLKKLFRF